MILALSMVLSTNTGAFATVRLGESGKEGTPGRFGETEEEAPVRLGESGEDTAENPSETANDEEPEALPAEEEMGSVPEAGQTAEAGSVPEAGDEAEELEPAGGSLPANSKDYEGWVVGIRDDYEHIEDLLTYDEGTNTLLVSENAYSGTHWNGILYIYAGYKDYSADIPRHALHIKTKENVQGKWPAGKSLKLVFDNTNSKAFTYVRQHTDLENPNKTKPLSSMDTSSCQESNIAKDFEYFTLYPVQKEPDTNTHALLDDDLIKSADCFIQYDYSNVRIWRIYGGLFETVYNKDTKREGNIYDISNDNGHTIFLQIIDGEGVGSEVFTYFRIPDQLGYPGIRTLSLPADRSRTGTILVSDPKSGVEYAVLDYWGDPRTAIPSGHKKIYNGTGELSFSGLDPDKEYYLIARTPTDGSKYASDWNYDKNADPVRPYREKPAAGEFAMPEGSRKAKSFQVRKKDGQPDPNLRIVAVEGGVTPAEAQLEQLLGVPGLWKPFTVSMAEMNEAVTYAGGQWQAAAVKPQTYYHVYAAYYYTKQKELKLHSALSELTPAGGIQTPEARRIQLALNASSGSVYYGDDAGLILSTELRDTSTRQGSFDPTPLQSRIRIFYADRSNAGAVSRLTRQWDGIDYPAEGDGVYSDQTRQLPAGSYCVVAFLKGLDDLYDYEPSYARSDDMTVRVEPLPVCGAAVISEGHSSDLSYDADQQEWRLNAGKFLKWTDLETRFYLAPSGGDEAGSLRWSDSKVRYVVKKEDQELGVLENGGQGVSVNSLGFITISIEPNGAGLNDPNYSYDKQTTDHNARIHVYKSLPSKSSFTVPEAEKKAKRFWLRIADQQLDRDGLLIATVKHDSGSGNIRSIPAAMWQPLAVSGSEITQALNYDGNAWTSVPLEPDTLYDIYAAYFHGDVMEGGYARVTEDGFRTPKQRKLKFILTRDKYSISYGRTASDNLIPVLEDTTGRSFDPAALKDGIRYFYANTADAAALDKLRADWTGGAYPEGDGVYSDQSEQTQKLPAGAYIAVGFLKDLDPDDYDPLYVRSGEANFTVEPVEVYGAVSINDGHSSDLKYDPENEEWQIDIRKSIKWSDLQTVFFADQDASKECAGLAWKNEDSSKVKYQVSKDQQLLGVLEQGDEQGIPLNSSGFLDISILSGSAGLNDPNYRYKDETWTDCIRIRVCKVLPNKDDFTIDENEKKAGSFKVHISNSQLDMDGLYITAIKHTASITPEVMEAMPQYMWQPLTGSVMEIRKGAEKNGVFWDMTEPLLSNTLYDVYIAYFKNGEIDSGCARITGDGFKTENPRRIRFTLKASENAIAYGRNANEIMTPVLEDESLRQNPPFDPGEVKGRIRYFYAEAGNKSAEERVLGIWDGGAYPAEGDGVYSDRNGRLAAGEYIAVGFLKGLAMDDYDPLYVSSNSVRFTVRPADAYGRIMVATGHSPDLSYDADQQEWRMDVRKYLKWSDFTTRFFTDPGANEEIGGLSWKDNLVQYVVKKDGKVLGVLKYGDSRGVSVNTTGSIAVSISRNDAGLNNGNYGYKGPASNPCETLNAYKAVLKKSDFILPEDEKKAKSFKVRTANQQLDMDGLYVIAVDGEGSGGQIDQISKDLWQEMTSSGLELRQAVSYGNSGWYSYTPLTPDKPYDVYAAYFKGDALDSPCTKITEEGFRSAKFKEMQFDKLMTGRPYIIYGETASHNLLPNLKDKNRRAGFSPQELESRIRYFYAESGNSAAEQELLQDWDGMDYPVEGGGVYSDRGEALPVGTYHAAGFLKDLDPDDYDPVYVSSNDVMFNVLPAGAYGAVSVNIGHSGELSFIPASNEWRIDAGKRITWSNLETRFFADAQRKEEIKGLYWNDSRVWYVVRQNGTELGVLKSNDTQGILLEEAGMIEISIIQNEALLNSKNYEYRGAAASNCTRVRVMAPELQITPVYTGIPYAYTLTDGHALTGFDPKGFVKVTDKRQGGLDITDDGKVAVRVYRDSAFTMEGITGAAKGDTIYFRATYNGEKAVSTKEGAVRIVEQRVGILPKDEDYALSFTTNPADEQLLGLHPHFEIKLYDEKGAAHPAGSPEYYVDGELSVAQCGLTEERFNRYDYYQEPAEVVPVFREADTLSGNYALEVGTCRIRIIPTVKVSFAGKDNRTDEKGLYYPERNEWTHKSIPGISIQELWALAGGQDVYENTDKIWRAEITYDGSKDTEGRRHETVEASVDEEYIPRVPGTGYLAFEYTPSLGREYISSVELTLRFAQQKYEPNDNVNLKMDPVEDVYYNGFKHVSDRTPGTKKNTPDLGVRITSTVNGKTYRLVEGKDYILKYKNNVEVCNIKEVKDTRKWPAVIAVGKGDYKGVSFTEYYSIRPIDPAGSYDQSGKMIWLTVTKGVNPYYQVDKNSRFSVDPVFAVASVYWDDEKEISGKRYATIEKGKIKYSVVSECRALEDAGEYYIDGAVKKAEGTYFGSRGIRMSLWAFVPEGIPEVKSGVERMEILDRDDFFDSFCVLPHGSAKIGAWINKYSAMEAWESTAYTCGGMKAVSANTYTGTINDKGFYTRLSVFKKDKNKTPMKAEDIEASLYDRKNGNRVWAFTEMGSVMDSTTQAGNYMLRLAPTEKAVLEKGMLPEPVWLKVSFRTTQKLSKAVDPKTVITRYYTNEGAERAIGGGIQVESLSGNCGFAISINKVGALKNRIDVYSKAPGQKGETWVASIAADEAGLINRTFAPYNTTPGTYKIIFRGKGAYSQKDKVVATYQVKPMDASGVKICLSENKDPFGPEVTEIPYNAGGYTYALDAEKSPYATDAYGHVYMTLYARNGKNGAFLRSDYLTNLLKNGSAKVTIKKGRNGKLAVTIKGLRDQNGREVVKGTIKITDDMALPVRGALSSNSLVLLNKGFTKDDRNELKKYSKKLVLVQYSAKKGIDAFGNYKTVALKYQKDYDFEAVSFNSPGSGVSANWVTFKPGTGGGFEGSASSGRMSADMGKGLIRLTGIAPIADQSYRGGQRVQPDRILVTGRIGKASKTYEIKKEDYGEGAKIDDMIFKVSFSDNRDVGKKKARVSVSVIPAGPEGLISASPKMARFTIK